MTTAEDTVLVEVDGGIGRITLNRPRAINALTAPMVGRLTEVLTEFADRADISAVLLTGAGERGLCAGGDIRALHADAVAGTDGALHFWREEYRLNEFISRYPKPYVALMTGLVLGGGVGVSAHGSHRIVTDSSRIGMPEVSIGFVPDVGGTHLLTRTAPALGTHLALTGGQARAADAIAAGLADAYVPSDGLPAFIAALSTDGADTAVQRFATTPPAGVAAAEWIETCYRADTVEQILEGLDGRAEPEAAAAAAAIRASSPTAVVVTLAALRAAAGDTDLRRTLDREFGMAVTALRAPDFAEGVRARIIDKDQQPRWSPASLAEVDPAQVDRYLTAAADLETPFGTDQKGTA